MERGISLMKKLYLMIGISGVIIIIEKKDNKKKKGEYIYEI